MDTQHRTFLLVIFFTITIISDAFPLIKTKSRFPSINKMTSKSHPMLASVFNVAKMANQLDMTNRVDNTGTLGAKLVMKPPKDLGSKKLPILTPEFADIAASMLCKLCQEQNDLACMAIHCLKDSSRSIAQPGSTSHRDSLNTKATSSKAFLPIQKPDTGLLGPPKVQLFGIALPTSITNFASFSGPVTGDTGLTNTIETHKLPKTFDEVMKSKKYQGKTVKEIVPSAVGDPVIPGANVMKPSSISVNVQHDTSSIIDSGSVGLSLIKPMVQPVDGTILRKSGTQVLPKTFGEVMESKIYQGRAKKEIVPSALGNPVMQPVDGIVLRKSGTQAVPKTFDEVMKSKLYQGQVKREKVPSALGDPVMQRAIIHNPSSSMSAGVQQRTLMKGDIEQSGSPLVASVVPSDLVLPVDIAADFQPATNFANGIAPSTVDVTLLKKTDTHGLPKTFDDVLKSKKYQGQTIKEIVPSPLGDPTSFATAMTVFPSVPAAANQEALQTVNTQELSTVVEPSRQATDIQNVVYLEDTLIDLMQGSNSQPALSLNQRNQNENADFVADASIGTTKNIQTKPMIHNKNDNTLDVPQASSNSIPTGNLHGQTVIGQRESVEPVATTLLRNTAEDNSIAPQVNAIEIDPARSLLDPLIDIGSPSQHNNVPLSVSFGVPTIHGQQETVFIQSPSLQTIHGQVQTVPIQRPVMQPIHGQEQSMSIQSPSLQPIHGQVQTVPIQRPVMQPIHGQEQSMSIQRADMQPIHGQEQSMSIQRAGMQPIHGQEQSMSIQRAGMQPIHGQVQTVPIQRPGMQSVASAGEPEVFVRKRQHHLAKGVFSQGTTLPTTTLQTMSPQRKAELQEFSRHLLPTIN